LLSLCLSRLRSLIECLRFFFIFALEVCFCRLLAAASPDFTSRRAAAFQRLLGATPDAPQATQPFCSFQVFVPSAYEEFYVSLRRYQPPRLLAAVRFEVFCLLYYFFASHFCHAAASLRFFCSSLRLRSASVSRQKEHAAATPFASVASVSFTPVHTHALICPYSHRLHICRFHINTVSSHDIVRFICHAAFFVVSFFDAASLFYSTCAFSASLHVSLSLSSFRSCSRSSALDFPFSLCYLELLFLLCFPSDGKCPQIAFLL